MEKTRHRDAKQTGETAIKVFAPLFSKSGTFPSFSHRRFFCLAFLCAFGFKEKRRRSFAKQNGEFAVKIVHSFSAENQTLKNSKKVFDRLWKIPVENLTKGLSRIGIVLFKSFSRKRENFSACPLFSTD